MSTLLLDAFVFLTCRCCCLFSLLLRFSSVELESRFSNFVLTFSSVLQTEMGFKRPFDCEDFQELPFKQARQVDYSNKMTQFADLYRTTSEETDVTGKSCGLNIFFCFYGS